MNINKNPHFLLGIIAEIKKVNFPSKRQTIKLTATVFIISLIVGVYLGIIDVLLTKLLEIRTQIK